MSEKNYSAFDLIRSSARQLVFFEKRAERYSALNIATYKKPEFDEEPTETKELRGCYSYQEGDVTRNIFFCVDDIVDNVFYKVKSNNDSEGKPKQDYDQWYFESAILQSALCKSLIMEMHSPMMYTPNYKLKENCKRQSVQVDKNGTFILQFGEVGYYLIQVTNTKKIIDFFKDKISHLSDYDKASDFDLKYKHKEYETLKDCFSYSKL